MPSYYPKVLIVGEYFDRKSGAGITLSNLFFGWDRNSIAVVATSINNPDYTVCEKFYQIGHKEIVAAFPFNMRTIKDKPQSGDISKIEFSGNINQFVKSNKSNLRKIKDNLMLFSGQEHRKRKFMMSSDLINWITEFSPDIIYSQLSSLELIRLVSNIHEKLQKPLVLHIMDDWPVAITGLQIGVFHMYWANRINREFRQLLVKASVLMSISEAMSEEYFNRYGLKFIPFHNPVDFKSWAFPTKNIHVLNERFTILYAGRIGTGIQNCLLDVASAIKNLIEIGLKIEYIIQATNDNPILGKLEKYDFVTIRKQVSYTELPVIFASVNLLLLPNDFDKKSISFLRYSMPTKASEFMASETPVLIYASADTAITKHAIKHKWAYVVSEKSISKLELAITELYSDEGLRKSLGCRARMLALKKFDREIVSVNFKLAIQNHHSFE